MKEPSLDQSAFPKPSYWTGEHGLTKRELFAVLALQGLISRYELYDPKRDAKEAVEHADALLEALKSESQTKTNTLAWVESTKKS